MEVRLLDEDELALVVERALRHEAADPAEQGNAVPAARRSGVR